jgi:large subunit ribosomal protein L6
MSRIGKLPIRIPDGVTVTVTADQVAVHGPKGDLKIALPGGINVAVEPGQAMVTAEHPDVQEDRALWGLIRVLISNMVTGVTQGFSKKLEINGVGYRAAVSGQTLVLNVGFSHPVEFPIPAGITMTVEKNALTVAGIDKQLVGETAAKIRSVRKPEPYKGKGIKYSTEVVRRKAGKVVKAAGAK